METPEVLAFVPAPQLIVGLQSEDGKRVSVDALDPSQVTGDQFRGWVESFRQSRGIGGNDVPWEEYDLGACFVRKSIVDAFCYKEEAFYYIV